LVVFATNDIKSPIWILEDQITGEIASEWTIGGPSDICHESLSGFFFIVQITAGSDMALDQ
jgi:hypothetical protein